MSAELIAVLWLLAVLCAIGAGVALVFALVFALAHRRCGR